MCLDLSMILHWLFGQLSPNNSFKPNLLRGGSGRYSLR